VLFCLRQNDFGFAEITDSLRAQFNRLPYPLVLRWARLDHLAVDSEDRMVVLLNYWYTQQGGDAAFGGIARFAGDSGSGSPPTDAQCRELSECVRLAHVSLGRASVQGLHGRH
jgi:hypothetical protein